jgi:hypothetical protein
MRWLIYHHHPPVARASLRIIEAASAEEAVERVRQTSPLGPHDELRAVAQDQADAADWAAAEKESFTITGVHNVARNKIPL